MKKQIVVIHGGETFDSYKKYLNFLKNSEIDIRWFAENKTDWKPWLRKALGKNYQVLLPTMPNKLNAQYGEWKLLFSKIIPHLNNPVVLVGHSLGASFLAKFLSENKFPKKISGLFLVSGVYDVDSEGRGMASFAIKKKLNPQTKNIYLYHSKDDKVVPITELKKFEKSFPVAVSRVFKNRGHFNQEKFPELVKDIKSL